MKGFSSYIWILILFVASGLASLIYQVVWFKQLSYFLGNSTYSQAIVLATFMGGLAIGAYLWGKKSDATQDKLKFFAFLELAIALYCFSYLFIFSSIESLFFQIVQDFDLKSDGLTVLILKFFVSSFTILLPTILMGGTLPVLVDFFTKNLKSVGKNVAILYFLNSLGAVIGTLMAGFWLIESFGLKTTIFIGASIELIVGIVAYYLSYKWKRSDNQSFVIEESTTSIVQEVVISERKHTIVLTVAAFSGFCAMMYEVIWLRLLIPILSSSTYSFTLILSAFIGGITLGSFLVYRYFDKIKNHFRFIGWCQLLIVISILLVLPFYGRLPYYIWKIVGDDSDYSYYLLVQFVIVFVILFIPTIFMGMTLPIASKLVVRSDEGVGAGVGKIFSLNTLGTVAGSLFAGLLFIPLIGIVGTIFLTIFINLLLVFIVFKELKVGFKPIHIVSGLVLVFILGVFIKQADIPNWKYTIMLSEVPRKINRKSPPKNYAQFLKKAKGHDEILFYREGQNGTFVVAQTNKEVYLFTNGKGDANSVGDLQTQVSLAQTPMILHPSPDTVLVIGFGAGTTIGNVLVNDRLVYAEVAEISKEVIDASIYFEHINKKPLENPKLRVIKDDGVATLRLSPKKYDLIISQPSNPWSAGVGNLFTSDFFQDCKKKLHRGGYVAQWFNLYEMDDRSFKLILRTILSEFDYVNLWQIGASDVLIVCSETPLEYDLDALSIRYDAVKNHLAEVKIHSFEAFLSQQIIEDIDILKSYAGAGPSNTEDSPLLEHWAPRAYFNNAKPTDFFSLDERKTFASSSLLLNRYLQSSREKDMNGILQAGLFQSLGGNKELSFYLADLNPSIYDAWAKLAQNAGDLNKFNEFLNLAASARSKRLVAPSDSILVSNNDNGLDLAIQYFNSGSQELMNGNIVNAIDLLKKAIKLNNAHVDAHINLANAFGRSGDYEKALITLDKAIELDAANAKAYFNRGYAKGFLQDQKGAVDDLTKTIELSPSNAKAYALRGQAYIGDGKNDLGCQDLAKALQLGEKSVLQVIEQYCK
jgi:spermidine synthase